jgi:hypothetical protein
LALLSSLAAGAVAIWTAFDTSIPGRNFPRRGWFALPIAAWLVAIVGSFTISPDPIGRAWNGSYCFVFMVMASLPMIALFVISLRQTRTLEPRRSLSIAGLGIAFMTLTLLTLCHPVTENMLDFVGHLLAGTTIVAVTIFSGRRWVTVRALAESASRHS